MPLIEMETNNKSSMNYLLIKADYWKSQAKKFCDFCKCWIADNKPSIEFHEKGKRHKENVTKRISEISKKSRQEHQAALKVDNEMKKMEEAALKAYMKDVEANADYSSLIIKEQLAQKEREENSANEAVKSEAAVSDVPSVKKEHNIDIKVEPSNDQELTSESEKSSTKLWYEAKSDEGHIYYWHIETGESRWEPPEEGFMSIKEQKKAEEKEIKKKAEDERQKKLEAERQKEEERARLEREKMKSRRVKEEKPPSPVQMAGPILGPAPRPDPYGAWKPIVKSEPQSIDWQLPQQELVEIKVPTLEEPPPEYKFKEKTVKTLGVVNDDAAGSGFKKRKFNSSLKRNMRQRLDEDG